MALFTDGPAATIQDLTAQDSQLLNVASAEGIDVTVKLALAHEAIGLELAELVARGGGYDLSHVAVTPALRLWHTYRTLESVYRDAYNSQLNDRYAGKRDQFRELGVWANNRLAQAGIGIVAAPIPQPAGAVVQSAAGSLAAGLYSVAMAWVNAAGEEGACSLPAQVESTGSAFAIYPPTPPAGVTGWNVYAGSSAAAMTRQNGTTLDPRTPWVAEAITNSGPAPGEGQKASFTAAVPRSLQRG